MTSSQTPAGDALTPPGPARPDDTPLAGRATLREQLAKILADFCDGSDPDWGWPGAADAVLRLIEDGHWVVSKIPHDETVAVGPRVLPNGWIRREAGESEPWHARQYAAQLLAAADAVESEDS